MKENTKSIISSLEEKIRRFFFCNLRSNFPEAFSGLPRIRLVAFNVVYVSSVKCRLRRVYNFLGVQTGVEVITDTSQWRLRYRSLHGNASLRSV